MSAKRGELKIFYFVDALGWEFVKKTNFMVSRLSHRSKLATVFGYSSTCDPTILTGVMPSEHRHFSFFTKGEGSRLSFLSVLGFLPNTIAGRHKFRQLFNRGLPKLLGWEGYFNLYSVPFKYMKYLDYTEKKNIFREKGINGGQRNLYEVLSEQKKEFFIHDWKKSKEYNLNHFKSRIQKQNVEVAYCINFELDAAMHMSGVFGERSLECAGKIEKEISDLVDYAQKYYADVKIYVFGDHGMTDCLESVPIMNEFNALGGEYGQDYLAVWDSTMGRFWFKNQTFKEKALHFLRQHTSGDLLSDDTLKKWGCYFADRYYGEYFYLMKPGNLIVPSFMGLKFIKGMHGYAPEDKDSWTCWLSNDPEQEAPESIQDIFQIISRV